jgi:predicted RND superfamily exporter protein
MSKQIRTISFITFSILSALAIYFCFQVKGEFNFEQFFPDGDPDLDYFYEFIEEFETDDNFLLIAIDREEGVFEQQFLNDFHEFSLKAKKQPFVVSSTSITQISYPLKTPFGFAATPAVHKNKPTKYEGDKKRLLEDERFNGTLISKDASSAVVALKLVDNIQIDDSRILMAKVDSLVQSYGFEDFHYLGRPNFQVTFIDLQYREIMMSALVSGFLVMLIMWLIFRKAWGVFVALLSIAVGMLLFMGMLGASGRTLNVMSALYPVLLIIVGTSDVIHIMSKYIDELRKGKTKNEAIKISIKEIGMATLLTSTTTAIGFLTLMTSKIPPIRAFGLNSAIGVIIAYVTVLGLTTAILSLFRVDQIIKLSDRKPFWEPLMEKMYLITRDYPKQIAVSLVGTVLLSLFGMSLVTTNYSIAESLPIGQKITEDYEFFESKYAGFRPFEIAVIAQDTFMARDYEVLKEVHKLEQYMKKHAAVRSTNSITSAYKSINRAFNGNKLSEYTFPETKEEYEKYDRYLEKMPASSLDVLVSKDGKKARISSRVSDIGSDTIKAIGVKIDLWVAENIDANVVQFRRTGTGILFDKNDEYIRDSILYGLGFAMLAVSLFMGLLFRSPKMVLISLVPNVFPLMIAGALMGFAGIELESGVAIVFAIVFGIAVDDTIHFLSRYQLSRKKGMTIEESIRITFVETGKAICLTSVILFFGFLVMLFSINPPSVTVGIIISVTLASALLSDMFTIPLLIRWLYKD